MLAVKAPRDLLIFFGLSAGITAILFALTLGLGTPQFDENDDVVMMRIASGEMTGEPDEHLVFINVIIGWLLKFCYEVVPGVNWYVLFLYSVQFISLVVLLFAGFVGMPRGALRWLYFSAVLLFSSYYLLRFQFTTTAFMAAAAGWIWYLGIWPVSKRHRVFATIIGILLIAISAMVRHQIFFLSVILFMIPSATLFLTRRERRRELVVRIGLIALIIPLLVVDAICYRSDVDWKDYREYTNLRGQIAKTTAIESLLRDYPRATGYEELLGGINWTLNDVILYDRWLFVDQDVYSKEKLQSVADAFGPLRKTLKDVIEFFGIVLYPISGYAGFSLLIALFAIWSSIQRGSKWIGVAQGLSIAFIVVFTACFLFYWRLPARLFMSLVFGLCLVPLSLGMQARREVGKVAGKGKHAAVLRWSAAVASIGVLIFAAIFSYGFSESNKGQQAWYREAESRLLQVETQDGRPATFFVWLEFPYQYQPVRLFTPKGQRLNMILHGWPIPSPLHVAACERLGITELMKDVYRRRDLAVICTQYDAEVYSRFAMEHYGARVGFRRVPVFSENIPFQVYQVVLLGSASPAPGA
ncbi:MAG: hypothetical protein AAF591_05450 [Verrucomicrobiota bacterium]